MKTITEHTFEFRLGILDLYEIFEVSIVWKLRKWHPKVVHLGR